MEMPLSQLFEDWTSFFDSSALKNLEIGPTLLNLALSLLLGQFLAIHYRRFARVLSNKRKFAPILVFIAATTMLVISVVKTSLALSLGLVGALSIIRFRTPIKEPEELAYLFLAVALGVGMGADQRWPTAIMMIGILLFMSTIGRGKDKSQGARTLLHVGASLGTHSRESVISALMSSVGPHAVEADLRRIDVQKDEFEASLIIDLKEDAGLGKMLDELSGAFPDATTSVVEADSLD